MGGTEEGRREGRGGGGIGEWGRGRGGRNRGREMRGKGRAMEREKSGKERTGRRRQPRKGRGGGHGEGVSRMHNRAAAVMGQLEAAGDDPTPDDTN